MRRSRAELGRRSGARIGGPEWWRQIVEKLAALAAECDRGFVPAVTAVSGPAPAWYRPEAKLQEFGPMPAP